MFFPNPFLGIIVLLLVFAFIGGIFRHMVYYRGFNPFGVILAIVIGMIVLGAFARPMFYRPYGYGYGAPVYSHPYYGPRPYAPPYYGHRGY
jgi:hypothetical protein